MKNLNPWQKFWGLFAVVFLGTALAVVAELWPTHDPAVVADLRAAECSEWRNLPAGTFDRDIPGSREQCQALRTLLHRKQINLRTEGDYDSYLIKEGFRNAGMTLGIWAGFVAIVYFLGWSSGRLAATLRAKTNRKPDRPETS